MYYFKKHTRDKKQAISKMIILSPYSNRMKKRGTYLLLILLTIAIGLLSRKITVIPAATGDALWATMIYFIIRLLLPQRSIKFAALTAVIICFAVEFSQLYRAPWVNAIRATLPGRLILGQGFLWSDLPAYALGVAFGLLIDRRYITKK